ncbi:pyridoxamine 5'-phosphate oxidase family protein [Nocardioides bruguierae]|uniref:pyridoxamine 5'-phosphate oxidase family protein n=1 Tax=Nocardioides bruguierae TaxID=2945102 RepID=UPI002021F604|nr:pyridoxamine 5'-phosphate oxidase family protein [Nocardioides bruguierae]MCL8027211.1 pyridoxamine 5'-phosphate oxidase family protein [Nocardioides bruguierae]
MLQSIELSLSESEALLRAGSTGRIAISTPEGPHIIPVNYSLVADRVVVRTSPYSLLGTHASGTVLAFETDHFDHQQQRGWSVLVRGRGEVITDPATLQAIRQVWPPRPWAAGNRNLHVGIRLTEITGRRLGDGWDVMETLDGHTARAV